MFSHHYRQLARILRILLIGAAALLILILLWRDFVPGGQLSLYTDWQKNSPFFSDLVPYQRVEKTATGTWLKDEPVYFVLDYPRPFQTLALQLNFFNPQQKLLEMGPQINDLEGYNLKALFHPGLNQIMADAKTWLPVSGIAQNLYQRISARYQYQSVEQFYQSLPDLNRTGYYGFNFPQPFLPKDLGYNHHQAEIKIPLQGSHQFYVALPAQAFQAQIIYQDVNQNSGADPVRLALYDFTGANLLTEAQALDDGDATANGPTSLSKTLAINYQSTSNQALLLKVETSADIYLQAVKTTAPYLVAKQRVAIAGGKLYQEEFTPFNWQNFALITSARLWTATTAERETLQTLAIGQEKVNLTQPFEILTYSLAPTRTFFLDKGYQVEPQQGGLVLEGRGVWAFDPASYFSPLPWVIDQTTSAENLLLDYIATDYQAPNLQVDGSYSATLDLPLNQVYAPTLSLKIKLAVPNLKAEDQVVIQSVHAQLNSDPITWQNFGQKLKNFYDRQFAQ